MQVKDRIGTGRRDELTIMTELLINMLEPRRLTHILYKTNLSYSQLRKYLSNLLHMGLAEEFDQPFRTFRITEKGRTFIDLISNGPIDGNSQKKDLETFTLEA